MLLPSWSPFECHEEVLYLQPMVPPTKRFDIFPPDYYYSNYSINYSILGDAQKVWMRSDFPLNTVPSGFHASLSAQPTPLGEFLGRSNQRGSKAFPSLLRSPPRYLFSEIFDYLFDLLVPRAKVHRQVLYYY